MANLSVVKMRGFIASVVAVILGLIVIGIAATFMGFNVPVISNIVRNVMGG
jgi:hypothetical protein